MASTPSSWRAVAERLKARLALSSVVGCDVELKRLGRELAGCCPFHDEATPSFYVNDAKGLFHCFGCGCGGDLIDYVMARQGLRFAEAIVWLGETRATTPVKRPVGTDAGPDTIAQAQAVWRAGRPLEGTAAECYLLRRGIGLRPAAFRFAWLMLGRSPTTLREYWTPALVARAQDGQGRTTGVQRICLTRRGDKRRGSAKLSLGRLRGSALRLGPPAPELILCEGPEDAATLAQVTDTSVWATFGASNLSHVDLPPVVETVTIAADADAVGRAAAEGAAAAYRATGRCVRIVAPPRGAGDWNEAWQAGGAGVAAQLRAVLGGGP